MSLSLLTVPLAAATTPPPAGVTPLPTPGALVRTFAVAGYDAFETDTVSAGLWSPYSDCQVAPHVAGGQAWLAADDTCDSSLRKRVMGAATGLMLRATLTLPGHHGAVLTLLSHDGLPGLRLHASDGTVHFWHRVDPAGLSGPWTALTTYEPGGTLTFELEVCPGGEVAGRVLDAEGAQLAQATDSGSYTGPLDVDGLSVSTISGEPRPGGLSWVTVDDVLLVPNACP